MHSISMIAGKTIIVVLRLTGRTGSALPGLVVEKTSKRFLPEMLAQLPEGVLVVSGTNGKTTTTKLITALLKAQGLRVLTNPTGSNFVRGIISAVVDKAGWSGKLPYDIAVFEQDEAHAVHFARQVAPRGVLVLNIMRDQMDRFGEIDTTTKMLQKLAASATGFAVLNANDERVGTIRPNKKARAVWFAHSPYLQKDFLSDDQLYRAESAIYKLAGKPYAELNGYDQDSVSLTIDGVQHRFQYHLPGGHNALNLTAALCVLYQVVPQPDATKLAEAILTAEPAFGRSEIIALPGGGQLTLQLIKNPGGCTQALRMLTLKTYDTAAIAINDDYPDGRDVSWLWDVDFRSITQHVICGGTRAADMANRLKYDDAAVSSTIPDLEEFTAAVSKATGSGTGILFCTYTAMRKIRSLLLGTKSGLDEGDA